MINIVFTAYLKSTVDIVLYCLAIININMHFCIKVNLIILFTDCRDLEYKNNRSSYSDACIVVGVECTS